MSDTETFLLVELSEASAEILAVQMHRHRPHRRIHAATATCAIGGSTVITDRAMMVTYVFPGAEASAGGLLLYDGPPGQGRSFYAFGYGNPITPMAVPMPGVAISGGLYMELNASVDVAPTIYVQWWEPCRCGALADHGE